MSLPLSSRSCATAPITVGTRVRIERDETCYPAKGTWPQFRGHTGTVVEINVDHKRPNLTEYGVVFGPVRRRPNGSLHGDIVTWFKFYEITALGSQCHAGGPSGSGSANHITVVSRQLAGCAS